MEEIKKNIYFILSKAFGRKIYDNLVKQYSDYLGTLTSKQILKSNDEEIKKINHIIKKAKNKEKEKEKKLFLKNEQSYNNNSSNSNQ